MQINLYVAIILALIYFLTIPTIAYIKCKNPKIFFLFFTIIYFVLLFVGTTFSIKLKNNTIFISLTFNNFWFSLKFSFASFGLINLISNLCLFLPIGFITFYYCNKKQFLNTILLTIVVSLLIEIWQWILPVFRTTEIFDVILNIFSGFLSSVYLTIITKLKSNIKRNN